MAKLLFLVTEDWYFCSHRLALGRAAANAGHDVLLLTRIDEHRAAVEAAGLRVKPLPWRRGGFGPWREVRALWTIWRTYRRERPDIVHHVAMKPIIYGSIAARLAGVPKVINAVAGVGFLFISERPLVRKLRPMLRWVLGQALTHPGTYVLVQNPDDESLVRDLGVAAAHVVTIAGSGIDTSEFSPRVRSCEPSSGTPVVTMVSRMLWDKGVGELIQAVRLLRARGVMLTVRLVGAASDDNPASISEATLRGWEVEGLVAWAGQRSDIPDVWRESDVAVLPSYREGLPRALLEAASVGLPLVATDVPGCREIVRHDETGLLVPPKDAAALAAAIERLVSEPGLRARMGRSARRAAETRYAESVVLASYLELYDKLMARRTSDVADA